MHVDNLFSVFFKESTYVVLPGVVDAMECEGTFYRFDDVPVHFEPFTGSPFEFTKSNEDTLNQLFTKIKRNES